MYGPSIDISRNSTGQKLPFSLLASILTKSREFQVSVRAGATYGLRLVPAAQPRARLQKTLKGMTSLVTGGTKASSYLNL